MIPKRGAWVQVYAVGGDVQIDVSAVSGDPEATISKSDQIRRAALAPANPSSQDISVAAMASRMAADARIELMRQQQNANNDPSASIQSYLKIQEDVTPGQFHGFA